MNPALKLSPAPVVSTTSDFSAIAGNSKLISLFRTNTPLEPSLRTTFLTPFSQRILQALLVFVLDIRNQGHQHWASSNLQKVNKIQIPPLCNPEMPQVSSRIVKIPRL